MLEAGVVCDRCDTLSTRRCVRVLIALLGLISSVDRDVQMQPMFVLSKVPRDDKAKSSKSQGQAVVIGPPMVLQLPGPLS